jgi:hypothetical protein
MRTLLPVLSLLATLATTLPAQGTEWVANGTFTGTLTPWVMGGAYSVNPGLEVGWDTTGLGASDSFGVNAGGQVTPAPYPPNTLEQQIVVVQGLTYEFRCDASGARPNSTTANADIGTIWVEVDNVEIARHAFGSYTSPQIKRSQICGRFQPTTSGLVTLKIFFQRQFLGGAANPRMNIDNVSVRDTLGPSYWMRGNRMLGTTVQQEVRGTPFALCGLFLAAAENPTGTPFPGVLGSCFLDLGSTATLAFTVADGSGAATLPFSYPNDTRFLGTPLWFQAAEWTTQIAFGHQFGVVGSR